MKNADVVEREVRAALSQVDDPELGINIVDLGLVRSISVEKVRVGIVLMMTTPTCPLGGFIAQCATVAVEERLGPEWDVTVVLDREAKWRPNLAALDVTTGFQRKPLRIVAAFRTGIARLFSVSWMA